MRTKNARAGEKGPNLTATVLIEVHLELGKLPFQITGIPEQHMVQTFVPDRPDQALDERV